MVIPGNGNRLFLVTSINTNLFQRNTQKKETIGYMEKIYKIYSVAMVILVTSFLFIQDSMSSDAYFTPEDIKRQILRAIEGSQESIDIAVFEITSNDILNALIKAQERGVHIRMVMDRKRTFVKSPLSRIHKRKKFVTKVLIQKGIMRNNFAVFDSKLLMTGSYYWNENVNKFNRYNVIFTDEAKVLVKYQREFDRLFYEAVTPVSAGSKGTIPSAQKETEMIEKEPEAVIPENVVDEERVVVSKYGFIITGTADGYIDMNFEEFNDILGVAGDLPDEQKESLWNRCIDKRVKWTGKVNYIGWNLMTGWMLGVTHGDTSVEIKLNPANKDRFSQVEYGNTVTYTGKLKSRVTRIFPYKLEDGDVIKIENNTKPLESLNSEELAANPYIVPISQGPKKVFIVQSFEDIDNIFGKGSNLSDVQKNDAWKEYKGKYVSWIGQIAYKNANVASGLRIGIMQKADEHIDIELRVGLSKKNKILKFQEGETVSYTGRLMARCGSNSPYVLEDGDITTLK